MSRVARYKRFPATRFALIATIALSLFALDCDLAWSNGLVVSGGKGSVQLFPQRATGALAPDGATLVTVRNGTLTLLSTTTGRARQLALGGISVAEALAFSPDGQTLVAVGGGDVMLWDVVSGHRTATLRELGTVSAVAFSADGARLATGAADGRVAIWDADTGAPLAQIASQRGAVTGLAFSGDGSVLAVAGNAGVGTWDLATFKELGIPKGLDIPAIKGLLFGPKGRVLVAVAADSSVIVSDLAGGSVRVLPQHRGGVSALAFDADGGALATGSGDATIRVFRVESGQQQLSLATGFNTPISKLAFDGNRIVAAGDSRLALWTAPSGRYEQILAGHIDPVADFAFGPYADTITSVDRGGRHILWSLGAAAPQIATGVRVDAGSPGRSSDATNRTGESASDQAGIAGNPWVAPNAVTRPGQLTGDAFAQAEPGSQRSTFSASVTGSKSVGSSKARRTGKVKTRQGVAGVDVDPSGELLASVSSDGRVRVADSTSAQERFSVTGHIGPATAAKFSANGRRLVTVGRDSRVQIWDFNTGIAQVLLGHEHSIRTVAVGSDGAFVASGGEETRVMLWDAETGRLRKILTGHANFVNALAFSPNARLLASGGADARLLVFDVSTGALAQSLLGHFDEVSAVAYSPDGKLLASGSDDSRVLLWDAALGQRVGTLQAHQASITAIAFSRDGTMLATAGEDSRIALWDIPKRQLVNTFDAASVVNSIAFSNDGKFLYAGSADNRVTRWNVGK